VKHKPLLIGMNNPVSLRPGHELYPLPEGCTGNRLWKMLNERTGATITDYIRTFERRNLVRGMHYDRQRARARAFEMWQELKGSGRTVVLLGAAVREAFDYVAKGQCGILQGETGIPPLLVHPQEAGGCTWRQIPHPSGRNLFYNEPKNREVVALLMEELYNGYREVSAEV
jgi:hypothetical protein